MIEKHFNTTGWMFLFYISSVTFSIGLGQSMFIPDRIH